MKLLSAKTTARLTLTALFTSALLGAAAGAILLFVHRKPFEQWAYPVGLVAAWAVFVVAAILQWSAVGGKATRYRMWLEFTFGDLGGGFCRLLWWLSWAVLAASLGLHWFSMPRLSPAAEPLLVAGAALGFWLSLVLGRARARKLRLGSGTWVISDKADSYPAAAGGTVPGAAIFEQHPKQPGLVGLKNEMTGDWRVVRADGRKRTIPPGKVTPAEPGALIRAGKRRLKVFRA